MRISKSRSWIEVNLQYLKYNASVLKEFMPAGCELMAVVKADAYGHGAVSVSKAMNEIGVRSFAVATIDEGIELRNQGIQGDILILGFTDISRAEQLNYYQLTQTVIDYDHALLLSKQQQLVSVHIKIDTGMHRLGISARDITSIIQIMKLPSIQVKGLYTHLSVADCTEVEAVQYTRRQIDEFYYLIQQMKAKGLKIPRLHIQSSYGLLNYPELSCDYARIGIALYGCFSTPEDHIGSPVELLPVLSLRSRIAMIREVAEGEYVGYGRVEPLRRDSRLAVIPVGYADGLPRILSYGRGSVLLHGYRAPIVGRVCMDQLIIDVTDVPGVAQGDIVTLIGRDNGNELSAAEVAKASGSITNELLSRLGTRLPRIYR
jgi:serine/alanine racemase